MDYYRVDEARENADCYTERDEVAVETRTRPTRKGKSGMNSFTVIWRELLLNGMLDGCSGRWREGEIA